jgi:hypothetical protein
LIFGDFGGFFKLGDQKACFWPLDLEKNMINL